MKIDKDRVSTCVIVRNVVVLPPDVAQEDPPGDQYSCIVSICKGIV